MKKMDQFATEMIPIRLVISIAIISAIVLMVAFGYNNLSITLSENHIENEFRTLESKLNIMVASGVARDLDELNAGDGTKRTHTFDLPDTLVYMAFGIDPDPNNCGDLNTGLNEDGSVFAYKVSRGNKHIIWLAKDDFKFREGIYNNSKWELNEEEQGYIVHSCGQITLTFELVKKNSIEFILIQHNDNIDF